MKLNRITATAAVAIGATAVAAGTAYAAPATVQPDRPARIDHANAPMSTGTDHGVGYHTAMTADGRSVVSILNAGGFRLADDGKTITVHDEQGRVFGTIPTGIQVGDRRMIVHPVIDQAGKRLTLTPVGQRVQLPGRASLRDINSQQWFMYELQHASLGALVGAIIGGVIGLFVFFVGVIPGAVAGAIIGELVAGGQPLIDSGIAYFSGR